MILLIWTGIYTYF